MIKENIGNKIHILDTYTANCIAAGEVAERPASIIKELVENSIDAGASRVEIRIFDSKCEKIQITDNGCGMGPEDMRLSIIRHATSKISKAEDLNQLSTLGFRGEALPSIAAVSYMTITSKLKDNDVAYRMVVDGGVASIPEEIAASDGTTVLLDRLFYNTPARKKFLRSISTEMAAITDVVSNLALSHLDIAFTLRRGNYRSIVTRGNNDLCQAMMELYGVETVNNMLSVNLYDQETLINVSGMVSLASLNRSSRQYHFFVNGRPISSSILNSAVDDAYYTLLPANRHPLVFLFIYISPDSIDVNVHPSKAEVKFSDPQLIRSLVTDAIDRALAKEERLAPRLFSISPHKSGTIAKNPAIRSRQDVSVVVPNTQKAEQESLLQFATNEKTPSGGIELHRQLYTGLYQQGTKPENSSSVNQNLDTSNNNLIELGFVDNEQPEYVLPRAVQKTDDKQVLRYSQLHVIGQYRGSYILAAGDEGLYLIDQHAAAERINYERLVERVKTELNAGSNMLAIPEQVTLSPVDHLLLSQHIVDLCDFGFIVEYFGDTSYVIRGVPLWCPQDKASKLLMTAIDCLQESNGNAETGLIRLREEELFMTACKGALKANNNLEGQDITALLADLDRCNNSSTCPHGRPIAILLSEKEIRRRFMRSSK